MLHESLGGEVADSPEGRFQRVNNRVTSDPMDTVSPLLNGQTEVVLQASARDGIDVIVQADGTSAFEFGGDCGEGGCIWGMTCGLDPDIRGLPMKSKFESEQALARVLVGWLSAEGWEVFQEVTAGGPICDIVAKRGLCLWAIECKLTLNLEVIEQALHWRHRANLVSVAVPRARCETMLTQLQVGVLSVNPGNYVTESVRPHFFRPRASLAKHLHEEQKTFCEAGGNRGGHWSPYKATCRNVKELVRANPGIALKELIGKVQHHYSNAASARGCIAKCAEDGLIPGVAIQREGKRITLVPA
jgi:hypothetical protein